MTKTVLVCSYHYAPLGTPRSFRWVNLTRGLRRKGWEVHVVTMKPSPQDPHFDPEWNEEGAYVHRTRPGPLYDFRYRLLPPGKPATGNGAPPGRWRVRLRSSVKRAARRLDPLLFPDKAVEWAPVAWRKARQLVRKKGIRVVITSGSPFSTHLIGGFLKEREGVRWIADYGDPWSLKEWPPRGAIYRSVERALETWLLRRADRVVVTTRETRALFQEYFPFLSNGRMAVIQQGYDPSLYPENGKEMIDPSAEPIRVCHTGTFYPGFRDPGPFLEGIRDLKPVEWEFLLVGNMNSLDPKSIRNLPPAVRLLGHLPHARCADLQRRSAILLLFSNPTKSQVPGKIFECLAARRPILVIANDPSHPVARMVREYRRGWIVPNDPEVIRVTLGKLQAFYREGRLHEGVDLSPVLDHGWNSRVEQFESILESFGE